MNTCPHCQQNTLRQVGQSIDCANRNCPGYMLTLTPEHFMNLTTEDFAEFEAGHNHQALQQIDIDQELFELRMVQLERDLAARQAARDPNAKTFG